MKLSLVSIILGTFLITSCDKDDQTPAGPSAREILTTRAWVFSEYKENGVIMTLKDPCHMDDFITFNSNGSYIRDEGATVCNAGDAQTFTDGWVLAADNKTLNILSEVSGDLSAISESSFTIRRTGANVFEYTYVKK